MHQWTSSSLIVLAAALVISAVSIIVIRRLSGERLNADSGPVGSVVAISVTVYSLILGLTVVATYDRFTQAEMAITSELNALFTTFRLADAYPATYRNQIKSLTIEYARAVNTNELFGDDENPANVTPGRDAIRKLYQAEATLANDPAAPPAAVQMSITALMALDDARGSRLSLESEVLPTSLWFVLVLGGGMTVLAIALVAPKSLPLHLVVALSTTMIIAMLLNLVAEMDRPFTEPIRVNTERFAHGLVSLESERDLAPPMIETPVSATPVIQ
ncbi:MAG: DUF4239 domain-containing protein [Thermomicrobiales bacterium]